MKFIITESKLEVVIRDYLNNNIRPDYSFGDQEGLHDFYRKDVEKYGSYDFTIDDELAYTYERNGILYIQDWLVGKLNNLFGYLWQRVFKKWFMEITGLHVEGLVLGG
jgi:hypothetical protein